MWKFSNNVTVSIGQAFTLEDGTQFPSNWLQYSSPEEKAAIGLTLVDQQATQRPDERFYWVQDNGDGTFTSVPKDLPRLKAEWISQVNSAAQSLLSKTDQEVVISSETGNPTIPGVLSSRNRIRERQGKLISDINACDDVEELITVVNSITWPDTITEVFNVYQGNTVSSYLAMINGNEVPVQFANTDPYYQTIQTLATSGQLTITDNKTDLQKAKALKSELAWAEFNRRLENSFVTLNVSAGTYQFNCNAETRENITGINGAIAIGIPVPNPRAWTPRGATMPIMVTHNDLALIGGALLNKKDELIQIYFYHKAMIQALTTIESVNNYDITAGYP